MLAMSEVCQVVIIFSADDKAALMELNFGWTGMFDIHRARSVR